MNVRGAEEHCSQSQKGMIRSWRHSNCQDKFKKKRLVRPFPKILHLNRKMEVMKCFKGLFRYIVVYIRNIEEVWRRSLLYRTYNGSNHVNPPPLIARNVFVTLPLIILPVNQ